VDAADAAGAEQRDVSHAVFLVDVLRGQSQS
jgi:hypothetical protein